MSVVHTLQVVGHLVGGLHEQVEEGFLDVQTTGASGQGLVGCSMNENGFVGELAFVPSGAEDNAEGLGEKHSGVSWKVVSKLSIDSV